MNEKEFLSLTGSPKGRIALAMIEDAESRNLIQPHTGCFIFEGTVGSTGIALAMMSKAKGYNCYIVMPGITLFSYIRLILSSNRRSSIRKIHLIRST